MGIKIRRAVKADLDGIAEIYEHIHTEEESGRVCIGWIRGVYPERQTAEAALDRGDLFVEELDGRLAGTAILNQLQVDTYRDAPWQYNVPDDQIMVMHTLVIDPYAPKCGLGRAFAAYYENYALENGCLYLRIDTNAKNINARRFYEKLDYREIGILPCTFNGIKEVNLVLLEKSLQKLCKNRSANHSHDTSNNNGKTADGAFYFSKLHGFGSTDGVGRTSQSHSFCDWLCNMKKL